MKLSELLTINVSLKDQLTKIDLEVLGALAALQATIDNLKAQLADVELTPEQIQSIVDVQAAIQALDDITPDAVVEEPAPVEPVVE